MRSALLCVFFALIVHKEGSRATSDEFRPIPIPIGQWDFDKREARVGTLQEAINTEKPSTVAAVPAHYWEDALRHSVYLTLVRDKIDQLITNGLVVSPDSKPDQLTIKEDSDHDLWEKIKKAPFEAIPEQDHPSFGDVTIMAKGRLMEDKNGFRFSEDERTKEDCKDDKCGMGVKAFWSVKRVRQRDDEPSAGKYHYELTFSVHSHRPKKQKKPFENPVRTFTVRENPPEPVAATPRPPVTRPQRALWFHKNIAPSHQARHSSLGLDRIFSNFFLDDEPQHIEPPRYKPNPYGPPQQYSKLGHVSHPSDHKKTLTPYPYRPSMHKYPRPPPPLAPQNHGHHYMDSESHNQYGPPGLDHRYISPSNIVKTTRPAVLPTPPMNVNDTLKNVTVDQHNNVSTSSENVTKEPEDTTVYKGPYSKPRPGPVRYFSEHIRPPVYNAPPGVFVTMDKKPFKPMPPLKYMHTSKPMRRPIDFRPSPQVMDVQYYSHNSTGEGAFRPILVNFTETDDAEKIDSTQSDNDKPIRKQVTKKPPKKHENIKTQRTTTTAPDIITVQNDPEEDSDSMSWANLLGAFTKTMEGQREEQDAQETSTEPMSSNEFRLAQKTSSTTAKYEDKSTTTYTTAVPLAKKRTRPPHKFVKPDKIKKHKRITTTTKAPEKADNKKTSDLTPQASSAATGVNKPWQPKNITTTTIAPEPTPTTTSKPTTTTQVQTTSYIAPASTTMKTESSTKQIEMRNKNRFRQTTLMIKGTSVKHDRWSVNQTTTPERKVQAASSAKYPPRRKGSNFHGYGSKSTLSQKKFTGDEEDNDKNEPTHNGYVTESNMKTIASTPNYFKNSPISTRPTYEESAGHYKPHSESTFDDEDERDDIEVKVKSYDDQESEDHAEFIFDLSSKTPSEKTNEINEEDFIVTEQTVVASSHSVSKNKTKCKKKKHQHLTPSDEKSKDDEPLTTTTLASTMTTKSSSDIDILDEILGNLGYSESTPKPKEENSSELDEEESENHEKYLEIDDDFEDFLGNVENRNRHRDESGDVEYDHDEESERSPDNDVSPFDNDYVNEPSKDASDKEYDDYHERSYSLLELMAME